MYSVFSKTYIQSSIFTFTYCSSLLLVSYIDCFVFWVMLYYNNFSRKLICYGNPIWSQDILLVNFIINFLKRTHRRAHKFKPNDKEFIATKGFDPAVNSNALWEYQSNVPISKFSKTQ